MSIIEFWRQYNLMEKIINTFFPLGISYLAVLIPIVIKNAINFPNKNISFPDFKRYDIDGNNIAWKQFVRSWNHEVLPLGTLAFSVVFLTTNITGWELKFATVFFIFSVLGVVINEAWESTLLARANYVFMLIAVAISCFWKL